MSAPFLIRLFNSIYTVSLAFWVAIIVFFSFAIAPIIFKVLDPESAGRFVRTLFPRYYAWLITLASLALPATVLSALAAPELRTPMVGVRAGVIFATILVLFYCSQTLTAAINQARDEGPEGKVRFDALHKRSVRLNSLVLLVGMILLGEWLWRDAPRAQGIVEPDPQTRFDADVKRYTKNLELERAKLAPKPSSSTGDVAR